MPTLKEIANSYNDNIDFDMRKTAEECSGDMDALLSGSSAPSPLLDRAKQLDKIAHSVASLDRSELFATQLKTNKTSDEVVQTIKTAEAKSEEPKVTEETEKTAQISTEAIEAILEKYAQFEEGQALIKKAYDMGQNMAILQMQDVEKTAGQGLAGGAASIVKWPAKLIAGNSLTGDKALARVGGAVAGGITGAAMTKKKGNRIGNAAVGAVLGGAGGHLLGEALEHPEIAAMIHKGK